MERSLKRGMESRQCARQTIAITLTILGPKYTALVELYLLGAPYGSCGYPGIQRHIKCNNNSRLLSVFPCARCVTVSLNYHNSKLKNLKAG